MKNEARWFLSDAEKEDLIRANGDVVVQDTNPAATDRDPAFDCFSNPSNRTASFVFDGKVEVLVISYSALVSLTACRLDRNVTRHGFGIGNQLVVVAQISNAYVAAVKIIKTL